MHKFEDFKVGMIVQHAIGNGIVDDESNPETRRIYVRFPSMSINLFPTRGDTFMDLLPEELTIIGENNAKARKF